MVVFFQAFNIAQKSGGIPAQPVSAVVVPLDPLAGWRGEDCCLDKTARLPYTLPSLCSSSATTPSSHADGRMPTLTTATATCTTRAGSINSLQVLHPQPSNGTGPVHNTTHCIISEFLFILTSMINNPPPPFLHFSFIAKRVSCIKSMTLLIPSSLKGI